MRRLPTLDADLDPREVIEALGPLLGPERAGRLDAIAAGRIEGVVAVLDALHDPHNAGAALRSCEAMGLLGVHIIPEAGAFRTSAKITQGCERWLDVSRHEDADACVAALHAEGYEVLGAVPGAALELGAIDPTRKVALAFGNEHMGLSPRLRALMDGAFTIPMHGASQSLNVSVSVAIALYAATQARRRAVGAPGDLDAEALVRLRARYYASDQRGARGIIERWRAERR